MGINKHTDIYYINRRLDNTLCDPGTVLSAVQISPHVASEIGTSVIPHFTDKSSEMKKS